MSMFFIGGCDPWPRLASERSPFEDEFEEKQFVIKIIVSFEFFRDSYKSIAPTSYLILSACGAYCAILGDYSDNQSTALKKIREACLSFSEKAAIAKSVLTILKSGLPCIKRLGITEEDIDSYLEYRELKSSMRSIMHDTGFLIPPYIFEQRFLKPFLENKTQSKLELAVSRSLLFCEALKVFTIVNVTNEACFDDADSRTVLYYVLPTFYISVFGGEKLFYKEYVEQCLQTLADNDAVGPADYDLFGEFMDELVDDPLGFSDALHSYRGFGNSSHGLFVKRTLKTKLPLVSEMLKDGSPNAMAYKNLLNKIYGFLLGSGDLELDELSDQIYKDSPLLDLVLDFGAQVYGYLSL